MRRAIRVSGFVFNTIYVVKNLAAPLLLIPAMYLLLFILGEVYVRASIGFEWCAMPKPHVIKPDCDGQECEQDPQDIAIAIQNISFIDRETYRQQACNKQNPFRVLERRADGRF